jgi:hypothetical protein
LNGKGDTNEVTQINELDLPAQRPSSSMLVDAPEGDMPGSDSLPQPNTKPKPPSKSERMSVDIEPIKPDDSPLSSLESTSSPQVPSRIANPTFFTDSHFFAAAHTWQDHIFSKWTSPEHAEKVKIYTEGVRNGTLAAPWKDEVWEREHSLQVTEGEAPTTQKRGTNPRKGKGKVIGDDLNLSERAGLVFNCLTQWPLMLT